MDWKLKRVEGGEEADIGALPGEMSVAEVETTLQRLVCRQLSDQEIISASLRKSHGGHASHLERVGSAEPISFAHGDVQYVATRGMPGADQT